MIALAAEGGDGTLFPMKRFWPGFLALSLLCLASVGCQQPDKTLSAEDDTNPYFHAALGAIQSRNFDEAAKSYEAALRANPDVVEAHYQLGIIYSEHLNDAIAAMYHFEEYLKLRPNGDNAQNVQARLETAKIAFAAALPNSPVQNAQAFAKIQSDNQALQHDLDVATQKGGDLAAKLAAAQKELAAAPGVQTTNAPVGTQVAALQDTNSPAATNAVNTANTANTATPPPAPTTATATATGTTNVSAAPVTAIAAPPAPGTFTTYTIVSGDSLYKISKHFYPGKVMQGIETIKVANTDILSSGKPLKIGTQLKIPQP